MLQQVTETLRYICGELRPPTLAPFGLEVALRSYMTRFQEAYPALDVQVDLMHDAQCLPEQMRLALFRVYQEALNNIVKHAQASCVLVRLALDENEVTLEIRDDGHGFTIPDRLLELARQGHLGLLGIEERVRSIRGRLEIESAPDEGTLVRVVAPLLDQLSSPVPQQPRDSALPMPSLHLDNNPARSI